MRHIRQSKNQHKAAMQHWLNQSFYTSPRQEVSQSLPYQPVNPIPFLLVKILLTFVQQNHQRSRRNQPLTQSIWWGENVPPDNKQYRSNRRPDCNTSENSEYVLS